jgi:hypothetical protein
MQETVEVAERRQGRGLVVGSTQPRRDSIGAAKTYDCPKAHECRWQEQARVAGRDLCPPRDALRRGIDPRVCAY